MSPLFYYTGNFSSCKYEVRMKNKLYIRSYHLSCRRIKEQGSLCLAFLSDMHNAFCKDGGAQLFTALETAGPDGILVGGDVLVGKPNQDIEGAVCFIDQLSKRYPVWYANGNHEQRIALYPEKYGNMGKDFEKGIEKTSAVRLVNHKAEIQIKDIPLTIYGLDPEERFYDKGRKNPGMLGLLEDTFGFPSKDRYTILLAHTPRYGEEYLRWGADLTLSGHYHGGVVLLGSQTGLVTPDFHLFSNYCCGIRSQGDSHMVVSAGAGEHTLPVRIHNPRELTLLRIQFGVGSDLQGIR